MQDLASILTAFSPRSKERRSRSKDRRRAEQCERAAKVATDLIARRSYVEMARRWRDMADRAEALERWLAAERDST